MALYNISSPSGGEKRMARFITDELRRMGIAYRKDRHGNIYAVKGNRKSYPCVVAHMDEVHRRKTGTRRARKARSSRRRVSSPWKPTQGITRRRLSHAV